MKNILGYYGAPYFNVFNTPNGPVFMALLFPDGGNIDSLGTLLPISAQVYNDIEALLLALPDPAPPAEGGQAP